MARIRLVKTDRIQPPYQPRKGEQIPLNRISRSGAKAAWFSNVGVTQLANTSANIWGWDTGLGDNANEPAWVPLGVSSHSMPTAARPPAFGHSSVGVGLETVSGQNRCNIDVAGVYRIDAAWNAYQASGSPAPSNPDPLVLDCALLWHEDNTDSLTTQRLAGQRKYFQGDGIGANYYPWVNTGLEVWNFQTVQVELAQDNQITFWTNTNQNSSGHDILFRCQMWIERINITG